MQVLLAEDDWEALAIMAIKQRTTIKGIVKRLILEELQREGTT